ncbi:MBL fold metallo-hydrolase [Legionella tunisiensis]
MILLLLLPIKAIFPAALVLGLAGLFPAYPRVKEGDARVDVLDVGQGLAVVVNTARHTLIYDTGVKFYKGGDMGKLAIIPYLNTLGVTKLDKVIISHPDLDHRGGLLSLQANYSIGELLVDKVSFYRQGTTCQHYPAWQWDGVSFRFSRLPRFLREK